MSQGMILRRGGGGSDYNFNVTAYAAFGSLPASASENSIAVITSTAITDWQLTHDIPTTRSDGTSLSGGEVFIITNTNSVRSFNAISSNSLMVYPTMQAQQYVSSVWTDVDVYIYQSGSWLSLNLVMYDGGDVSSVTGGWTSGDQGTYLYYHAENGSSSLGSSVNTFDCSKFQTLRVEGSFNSAYDSYARLYLSTNTSYTGAVFTYVLANNNSSTAHDIDISGVSGTYYIVFRASSGTGTANVANLTVNYLDGR